MTTTGPSSSCTGTASAAPPSWTFSATGVYLADGLRRRRFGELMDFLVANGVAPETARTELLKVMRGERSKLLEKYRPPADTA